MADAATLPRTPRVVAPSLSRAASLLGLLLLWWVVANVAASPQLLPGPVAVLRFAWQEVRN
ncbi:MAG TPA: hypothetical protein VHO91_13460, partial [Rhodopila sp.]|nr:hypothetical protein [Rhodopila sp.]